MSLSLPNLIFFVGFSILSCSSSKSDPLNGQHLRVIWPNWSGNRKGLSGPLKGGVVLDFLSARFNFTYEMVRVNVELEPPVGRGQINYLIDNLADLLINSLVPTIPRNQIIDLTTYWVYDYFALVIPIPDETANTDAVIKPFQWPIWLGLGVSIVCVIAILSLFELFLNQSSKKHEGTKEFRMEKKMKARNYYIYVYGMLLSQGGSCASKQLAIRLVSGVWTLATFIFVQAYSSVLFTYVVAPVNRPLINSIYDVLESNDINLLVREGSIDLFMPKSKTDVYTKIQERLDSNSNSRCTIISDCIKQITPGSRNAFMGGSLYAKDAIRSDFKRAGKCNLQFAKEGFTSYYVTFALQKNSPYTESINKGLLEFHQTGIIEYLDLWFRQMPPQCNGKTPTGRNIPKKNLSLKNLSGAFIVIAIGVSLSFLAFLLELVVSVRERHPRGTRKKVTDAGTNEKSIDE